MANEMTKIGKKVILSHQVLRDKIELYMVHPFKRKKKTRGEKKTDSIVEKNKIKR